MIDARGREITLSGPLDTEVSLGLNMGRGPYTAALTGVAVTPTGSGRHTLAEAQVASVIATEFLPFGIRSWGGGGSAGVALMTTRTLGQGSVGVGAGFLSSRQYSPFRNPDSDGSAGADFVYQPGNRLQLRAAAERNLTRSSRLTLGFTFERTNADVMEENDLFRPGNRYQALGSYAFVLGGRSTAILYTGGMRADGGVVLDPVLINDFSSRTLGLVGAGMRVPVGGVILVPDLGGRIYRRGSGLGQGYIGDAGLAMELPSGPHAITSGARFRYGNLVAGEGMESRITGVDLTLNVRFGR
jgi:hypothetical protein